MFKTFATAAVIALSITTFSGNAFAGSRAEAEAACMSDAFKFCMSAIPNVSRVETCMKQNFTKLSPGCKAQFK
ncbi:MAG: hypothetical protein HXY30_09265 [Pseudorhodoplanes sp.]|nr:hypothetical protein [Pseudorhodoplanes sp.]